jgi:iron complex outermembrane receptor protein
MINTYRKKIFAGITPTLLALVPLYGSTAVLEEIVVTAQKRAQNLQDVGISVSAFSGEQMDALGIRNTTEIVQQIPSLQINEFSPQLTTFNLRGVSQANFQDYLEAPVAVFVDDTYVGSMNAISGQLFDVERVEVLRGPQGTLFGRNATGGLIHYVSKGADSEEFNGYVEAGVGDYSSKSLEAAFGGSLTDNVRGRFAARWEEADGYIEATVPGVEDIHSKDGYAIRGTLQVDFSDNLRGDFWLKYAEDDDLATGGYTVFPCDPGVAPGLCAVDSEGFSTTDSEPDEPFEHGNGTSGSLDREATSLIAKFNWAIGEGMNFVSITSYFDMDKSYVEDGDGTDSPVVYLDFYADAEYTQFSQEFRLNGESDAMRWQVGFFYLDMETEGEATTFGPPVYDIAANIIFPPPFVDVYGIGETIDEATTNFNSFEQYTLESKNWSIFGQVEFDLTDALTLILGYRWSEDEKDLDYNSRLRDSGGDAFSMNDFLGAGMVTPVVGAPSFDIQGLTGKDSIEYDDYAARVQLDWRVNEDTLLFASWNRGIKGGNWSVLYSLYVKPDIFTHDEEVLDSYEIGVKTEFLDGKARLNANIFYYDYKDYQAFSAAGLVAQVLNSDATNQGAEVELFLTPNESWDIVLGLSLLDSEVDEIQGPSGSSKENVEFPNAPGYSFNYLVRYNWDALGGNLALQLDGFYDDDQYLEVSNSIPTKQDAGGMSNVRATYTSGDSSWSATAWVTNIEDEERKAYTLDLGEIGGITGVYQAPRMYGVSFRYNFGE